MQDKWSQDREQSRRRAGTKKNNNWSTNKLPWGLVLIHNTSTSFWVLLILVGIVTTQHLKKVFKLLFKADSWFKLSSLHLMLKIGTNYLNRV